MSPSSREREREYARRRYEKWAAKQAQRELERRKVRRNAAVAGGTVVAVLAIVLGVVALTGRSGSTSPAAAPSASSSASPAASAASASSASNPCPTPTVKPPAKPASYKNVPPKSLAAGRSWKLTLKTTCGTITALLDGKKAPQATASAIFLARKGFWNGTACHRLTTAQDGIYVLQCGRAGVTSDGKEIGPGYEFGPVENAPKDGIYPPGTIAMARTPSPNSNGSQFFLVYKQTKLPTTGGGYTVLGHVLSGLDVVQKVAAGGVSTQAPPAPARPISIVSATVTPA